MHKLFAPALMGALALTVFATTPAQAGLDSCGNIDVEASAQCKVETPSVSCEASCEPLAFKASCAAKLQVECEADCPPPQLDVECTGSCSADCEGSCEASASFDCSADCEVSCDADCDADCSAHCEGQADGGSASGECEAECEASCQANCDASCEASCQGQAQASCEGKCEASCEGSCEAKANFECQVECQSESYASCEAELRGGCEAKCETNNGVASCDGDYVDHGGNLEDCLSSLEAAISASIDGYAEWESSASCENGTCTAEAKGEAGASCAAAPNGSASPFALAFGLLGLVGLRLRRRAKNRAR